LEIEPQNSASDEKDQRSVYADKGESLKPLLDLSGEEVLDKIMEWEDPREMVRQISQEDFFWLLKKIGEDDCLPMLEMASDDQKQYLMDLVAWEKDCLDLEETSDWLGRMVQADPSGLAKWFFSKGEALAYYYLFKNIQVEIRSEDDDHRDFGENFITLDGVFYIRVHKEEFKERIINILRAMADEDLRLYQELLSTLAGVIPAELEENMYRLRNVRLAEHGFLPFEEALAVYTPLDPDEVKMENYDEANTLIPDKDALELTPVYPLYHVREHDLLSAVFSEIGDELLLSRLRIEFAGLCNQILSADGIRVDDLDTLIDACKKSAGHLNLALEKLCGNDTKKAAALIKNTSLVSLFRIGFGQVLRLKWETERWLKTSWFFSLNLGLDFWSEEWGETLNGILKNKPQLYVGVKEKNEFRDFKHLSEINDCRTLVHRLEALDKMMEQLTESYPLPMATAEEQQLTFYHLLFNLWARKLLNLEPSFSAITEDQVKDFFNLLRADEDAVPFRMTTFKDVFIRDFRAVAPSSEPKRDKNLEDALALIWQVFTKEYERVAIEDLDQRFSKFVQL
jgi:hypothetical protein